MRSGAWSTTTRPPRSPSDFFLTSGNRTISFSLGATWVEDHVALTGTYRIRNEGRSGIYEMFDAEQVAERAPAGAVVKTLGRP
ncbi:hypothetical protein ACETK8_08245 [Brevundimonas staleyi]|uniref:Uncharacterized protein n=1 Tax=Brevundimonas staleyi TaxID=74326 RepID=A0ABW0FT94_9CAUL